MKNVICSLFAALALSLCLPTGIAYAKDKAPSEPEVVLVKPTLDPNLNPVDHIVAVVDEDVILKSELDRAEAGVRQQYVAHPDQLPPDDVLKKQVLERLILMRLQLARAADSGVKISDAELDQAVQRVAQQNKTTPEQLRQQLAAQGLTFDQFRNELRDEMTVQDIQQKVVMSRVQVSEAEIDSQLSSERAGGAQVRLAHILIGLPDGATPEQIKAAQTKVDGVRDLIQGGKLTFSAAAIRYSDSPNALEGGDLGWRSVDEVPPAFVEVLKTLKKGGVTAAIRGPSGFQLLTVVDTREAGAAPVEQKVTEYHAQDIMVRTGPGVTAEQAKAKIDAIRARLAAGEDFAGAAQKDSDDEVTKGKGGDMGWFTAETWGSAVGGTIASLKDGELSQPFRSDVGWHLIQRLGSRQTEVGDKNQREAARQTVARRKAQDEYERFLRQLRSDAYVDIRLDS